jgi:hypothetical protein
LIKFVLDETESQAARLLARKEKDKKVVGQQVQRLLSLLECLRGRDDQPTEAFLLKCFARRDDFAAIKSDPSGQDIRERLVQIMAIGPPGAQSALADAHGSLSEDDLHLAFIAACHSHKPREVFDLFSPYFTAKAEGKKAADVVARKRKAIQEMLTDGWQWRYFGGDYPVDGPVKDLDPRWLDLAIAQGNLELVKELASPGHKGAEKFLSQLYAETSSKCKDPRVCSPILRGMVRMQHPAATKAMIDTIEKLAKQPLPNQGLHWISQLIPELPKDSVSEFEALLVRLPDKAIDQLLDYVTQLKNKP